MRNLRAVGSGVQRTALNFVEARVIRVVADREIAVALNVPPCCITVPLLLNPTNTGALLLQEEWPVALHEVSANCLPSQFIT